MLCTCASAENNHNFPAGRSSVLASCACERVCYELTKTTTQMKGLFDDAGANNGDYGPLTVRVRSRSRLDLQYYVLYSEKGEALSGLSIITSPVSRGVGHARIYA